MQLQYAKLGSRGCSDGSLCTWSTTNAWFLYRMVHISRKWKISWLFKRLYSDCSILTDGYRVRRTGWQPVRAQNLSDLPPSALAGEGFTTAETERERESSCHSSTLRYRKRSLETIKWMQACRVNVWDAQQESTRSRSQAWRPFCCFNIARLSVLLAFRQARH